MVPKTIRCAAVGASLSHAAVSGVTLVDAGVLSLQPLQQLAMYATALFEPSRSSS